MSGVNEPTMDTKMIGRRRSAACIAVAVSLAVLGTGCSSDRALSTTGTRGPSHSTGMPSAGGNPATEGADVVGTSPASEAASTPRPVAPVRGAVPAPGVAATRGSAMPGSARVTPKGASAPSGPGVTEKNLAEIDASLAEIDRELTTTNDELRTTEGDPNP